MRPKQQDLIFNELNKTARQPLKRGNPYDKPAGMSFYDWMSKINYARGNK